MAMNARNQFRSCGRHTHEDPLAARWGTLVEDGRRGSSGEAARPSTGPRTKPRSTRESGGYLRTVTPRRSQHHEPAWTFLTNHAHVLLAIAQDPDVRIRDLAERVGITERAVARIVTELVEGGYLERRREGRRNRYAIRGGLPLRHTLERHRVVHDLLALAEPPRRRRA